MPFKKGQSGNPTGRPRNPETNLLRKALEDEGKKRGVNFWTVVAQTAFTNPTMMLSVMKKFIPDLLYQKLDGELKNKDVQIIIMKSSENGRTYEQNPSSTQTIPREILLKH